MLRAPDIRVDKKLDEDEILKLEYDSFFQNEDDPIYRVQVFNNLQVDQGVLYNTRQQCEFCGLDHKDNCEFKFKNKDMTVK